MNNILKQPEKSATIAVTTINNSPLNSTDEIVSLYEEKINRNISFKIIASTKSGISPIFTSEEISYLQKKAIAANVSPEVEVITEDPPITLKKGNTEINIRNAASLVRRMDKACSSAPKDIESSVKNIPKEMFEKTSTYKEEYQKAVEEKSYNNNNSQKSGGKNAYEIRESILGHAIEVVKLSSKSEPLNCNVVTDRVLHIASRFYAFVENKK
jgi:hypothetical protein